MAKWFLLFDNIPLSAYQNMARDEYLFHLCHKNKWGFLRLYSWQSPTFSFGVSQKISRAIDVDFITANKCYYVRRITGGKTVLHHDEITYAVISSEDIFYKDHDLYKSYTLISQVLVDAFRRIGVGAYLSPGSSPLLSRTNNPCFSFPTPNELEIDGKKIVGSAQKRNNQALLQHGSIPLSMDYGLYAGGARSEADILKRSMTTLSEVSDKSGDDLCRALIESFHAFIGVALEEFEFDGMDMQSIAEIETKYSSYDWNHRL